MLERQDAATLDDRAQPQAADAGRDRPDEDEGYPFTLDDDE
jgi:hypothetical protein